MSQRRTLSQHLRQHPRSLVTDLVLTHVKFSDASYLQSLSTPASFFTHARRSRCAQVQMSQRRALA
eukprot:741439-Rhodomonas_salina.3